MQSANSVKPVHIASPEIQNRVKRLSQELRQAYIDYIGALSTTQPRDWWRTSVSEKNPYVSETFFNACCVKACLEYVASVQDAAVIVEDPALRRALSTNLKRAGLNGHLSGPIRHGLWRNVLESARITSYQVYFFRHAIRIFLARYWYRLHIAEPVNALKRSPLFLTNTWVDRRAYSPQTGEFKDTDFSDLGIYLRSKGHSVAGLANISFEGTSYKSVARYFAESGAPFLVPHAFLKLRDLIPCLWRSLLNLPRRRRCPPFAGLEINDLIFEDLRQEWITQREAEHVLLQRMVKRFKESGIVVERFIYTFENHTWERVMCDAIRKAYPSAKLIGYQPNGMPLMLLNYFISEAESRFVPLPDRIIANGAYAARLLAASGYGRDRVVLGGGLRQSYLQPLLYKHETPPRQVRGRPRIVVTPSIGRSSTVELILKIVKAFDQASELDIVIKCHPSIEFERLKPYLGPIRIPGHIRVSVEPITSLLPSADLLIYNDGTFPAAEALAFGIPVIFVEPEYGLSLDSLDGFPNVRRTARSSEEIAKVAFDLLSVGEAALPKSEALAAVRQLIGQVSEATYEMFRK